MATPFDEAIEDIKTRRYHNQRQQHHSDIVCQGILRDLRMKCEHISNDLDSGVIGHWMNVPAPGARNRHIDLLIGEPSQNGKPDHKGARICIENKSVVTAHRNKDARYDDLNELVNVLQEVRIETIVVGTVIIGVADRFLNVADRVTPFYKDRMEEFEQRVLPRLSSGDQSLWTEFSAAVSVNKKNEARKTLSKFLSLPVRTISGANEKGFDFLLLVPAFINNVDPPSVPRQNSLGIDVDRRYDEMLALICDTYKSNWPAE